MAVSIGDLVQFKQEKTMNRKCWRMLPENFQQFRHEGLPVTVMMGDHIPFWIEQITRSTVDFVETKKIPMSLIGTKTMCFSNSKLKIARDALTKTFGKVMTFQNKGEMGTPEIFWVLLDDLEDFSDKSYLSEFAAKLKQRISEQKITSEQKI